MLMNNLDPENAERPEDLVVYGGTGKAARSWEAYDALVRTLTTLEDDETMLVQSGKPVGVMRTHEWAPRVLIANSNLVGDWANWEEFRRLEDLGLTMYGQMTAGLVDLHRHPGHPAGHLRDVRRGRRQAVRRHAGRHHHADRRARRHGRRPAAGRHHERRRRDLHRVRPGADHAAHRAPLPRRAGRLARATPWRWRSRRATSAGRCRSGCSATPPRWCPALLEQGAPIDIVTDQTSAHDPLFYLPVGVAVRGLGSASASADPAGFTKGAQASMAAHVRAMVEFQDAGAEVFDYGNSIRDEARKGGYDRAFEFPGFVPAYIRPLFCEGKGPFRWAALSGDPADIAATDRAILELFPDNERLHKWITMAGERVALPGPAGAHLLARVRRAAPGRPEVQRDGGLAASSRRRS